MMRSMWLVFLACVLKCWAMSPDELEQFSDFIEETSQLDQNLRQGADFGDYDRYDGEEDISEHAWEDSGKFEGDLILNDRQRRLIVQNVEGLSRNGLIDSTKRWPNNEVIYFIQREHFNSDQVQAIESGIEELVRASCVKFRPYIKGDRDAVVIQGSRRGCFSQVGYQGGYQVLNLSGRHPAGRGCFRHGTVVHELLHTLGFYHMQSSPDRDDYIDVLWENILQPARHNFRKYDSHSVTDFGVGYDYDSVLHYSRKAFSSNGKDTLVPKQVGSSIGQRLGLSDKDTQKLNKMYCDADSQNFEADTISQKHKKKKKPKNLPFQGQGIGYHYGKTVIIKIPATDMYKVQGAIPVLDYATKTQTVPEDGAHLYQENMYPYTHKSQMIDYMKPKEAKENPDDDTVVIVNNETPPTDKIELDKVNEERANWESSLNSNPNAEKMIANDESLVEDYESLAKVVKQKVYPEYTFHINKDYSQFYDPSDFEEYKSIKYLNGKFGKSFNSPVDVKEKPIKIEREQERNNGQIIDRLPRPLKGYEDTDSTYRTSLPIKKTYSSYDQTETPNYATLGYLKDRHNYSHLYSPKINDERIRKGQNAFILNGESPLTVNEWYKKESLNHNPANYNIPSYAELVAMEHKREENPISTKYYEDQQTELPKKSQPYKYYYERGVDAPKKSESYVSVETPSHRYAISGEYYDENSTQSPKKSEGYSLFGVPNPLTSSWYKPVYSNQGHSSESYSGGIPSHQGDR